MERQWLEKYPAVMVSSTFFDLREIRHQLAKMIESDLAYLALISESTSFPIEPDVDAIENCRRRVEKDADILVLVIGHRYGFVERQSGKSVTNLEYLTARAKGIPIYAFIEHQVLTLFEAWHSATPDHKAAFAETVGDVRLFEFIEHVRSVDSVWMNGFGTSDDIIAALRTQLAYLMMSALTVRTQMNSHPQRALLNTLSPNAFRLAVERPSYWEYLLFAQVLQDEVEAVQSKRRQYDLGLAFGQRESLKDVELLGWCGEKLSEVQQLIEGAVKLTGEILQEALGPPGIPGSIVDLVFVARQLGTIYNLLIEWTQAVRRVRAHEEFNQALRSFAHLSSDMISSIGLFGSSVRDAIHQAMDDLAKNPPVHGETRELQLTLTLTIPESSLDVARLFEAAYAKRGAGDSQN